MPTATSSKTNTAVAALAALGLSAAAGFAYWGAQNWDTFNSDYYKDGYFQELNPEHATYDEKMAEPSEETTGLVSVTPGYRIPGDIVPGYRMPGEMPSALMEAPNQLESDRSSPPEPTPATPDEESQKKKDAMNDAVNQPPASDPNPNPPEEKKPESEEAPTDPNDKKPY